MKNTKTLEKVIVASISPECNDDFIDVLNISDDIRIRSVFRRRFWKVDDGIDFLLGIYSGGQSENGMPTLKTLDGNSYCGPEHTAMIEDLFKRHDLMREIWDHSTERARFRPIFFIKWGLQNKEICRLSWLDDAQRKGLVPMLNGSGEPQSGRQEEKLTSVEKSSLLKIIAGLSLIAYSNVERGLMAEIGRDLEKHGLGLSETTLNKHLKDAWDQFINKSTPKT